MSFSVEPGVFALAALPGGLSGQEWARLSVPNHVLVEAEETSVLGRAEEVRALCAGRGDARLEDDQAWIRFEAPMGWEVVGFLARVARELADAGVPIGALASHARDHLFVAQRHLGATRAALARLFPEVERGEARAD